MTDQVLHCDRLCTHNFQSKPQNVRSIDIDDGHIVEQKIYWLIDEQCIVSWW